MTRWLRVLCVLLAAGAALPALAGDIQVACEPGLRVYLDGRLAGTSSALQDGLFLTGVGEGTHAVRVEKDGHVPQSFEVRVRDLPIEVKVKVFVPLPPARAPEQAPVAPPGPQPVAADEQPAGSLLVISAPQNCSVAVDGSVRAKSTPLLLVEGLAPGEHAITFSREGYEPVSGTVAVESGTTVKVRGDLLAGRVEVVREGKGSLRVTSTPVHCTVRFLGVTREKTRGTLNLTHVPAGEHRLVASWGSFELATTVTIAGGQCTLVHVSFVKGDEPFVVAAEPE